MRISPRESELRDLYLHTFIIQLHVEQVRSAEQRSCERHEPLRVFPPGVPKSACYKVGAFAYLSKGIRTARLVSSHFYYSTSRRASSLSRATQLRTPRAFASIPAGSTNKPTWDAADIIIKAFTMINVIFPFF